MSEENKVEPEVGLTEEIFGEEEEEREEGSVFLVDGHIEFFYKSKLYSIKEDIPFDVYMSLNMPLPNSSTKDMLKFQLRMIKAHLITPEYTLSEISKLPSKVVSKLIALIGEDYKGF